MASRTIQEMLEDVFDRKHIRPMLKHFDGAVTDYRVGEWGDSIAKMGKLLEAALKGLCKHASVPIGAGRDFKVDVAINGLAGQGPKTAGIHDSVRLTIPRACRFMYEIASNRGGRHDPGEVDPNEMDAVALMSIGSWVVAEMVRVSQKGSVMPDEAEQMVTALTERHSPVVETVDNRVYFHVDGLSARQVAVLALWHQHPKRLSKEEVIAAVTRHRFSRKDAQTAIGRIAGVVDDDGAGNLRLLGPGLQEAEELVK
jgi:hypothetical protein